MEQTVCSETSEYKISDVVCILLGNSPAYEFYITKFRNTLSVPYSQARLLAYEDLTECYETSEYKIQTPEQGESLK